MKRFISALVTVCLILSLIPVFTYGAVAEPIFATSFEGDWQTSSWYVYNASSYEEGILNHAANYESSYITDGSSSLYIIDKNPDKYFGLLSPYINITEFGTYTMEFDAQFLEGCISAYIRYYNQDKSEYSQTAIVINGDSEMKRYSHSYTVTPDTPYIRLLFTTQTTVNDCEGYIDNLTFTQTGEFDQSEYESKKLVTEAVANAAPGDVIEIPDGVYIDYYVELKNDGTEDKPITLKAKNPGGVVFTGVSNIIVKGDYVKIEGIRFDEVTSSQIVKFNESSYGSGIYDCVFYNCHPGNAPDSEKQYWVMLRGLKLTVENCFFYGKHSMGQMVESSKSEATKDVADEHLIKNCYFGNIKRQNENGYEAIRLGSSTYSFNTAKTIVEGCFFEKCDGEAETISIKSCEVTVRNSTLYNTNGSIVFRHGDRSDVYGNLFIGASDKRRLSGIRIIGEDHKVHDNYFYNMANTSQVLVFYSGCPYENIENHYYYPVKNAEVYNNTFIGSDRLVTVGDYAPNSDPSHNRIIAPEGYFKDNVLVSFQGSNPMIQNGDPAASLNLTNEDYYHKVEFSGNIAYGKSLGYNPDGIEEGYFELTEDGNYYSAPNGKGADLDEVKKAPTSPFDIISDWIRDLYYESGLIEFEIVANDIFNDENVHINNLIPFDVKGTASEGGTLTLKENGATVSDKLTFKNNPEIEFSAIADTDKKIARWLVNGIEVNKNNIDTLGVVIDSPVSDTLIINNLNKNFDIQVEFIDYNTLPENIAAPVFGFGGTKGNVAVKNQNGITVSFSGYFKIVAARLEIFDYAKITEYGFMVSEEGKEAVKAEALVPLTDSGAFGMLIYKLTPGKTYTVYPYATYELNNGTVKTLTGNTETFVCE